MKFKQYLDDIKQMPVNAYAKLINEPQPTLWRLYNSKGCPRAKVVNKIVKESGGVVTHADIYSSVNSN